MSSSLDSTNAYVAPPRSTKASSDEAAGAVTVVADSPSDNQGADPPTAVQRGAVPVLYPGGGASPGSGEAGAGHTATTAPTATATATATAPDTIEGAMQNCQVAPQQQENGFVVVDPNTAAIMSALQAEFTDEAFQKFDPTVPLGQHLQEAAAVAAAALLPPPAPSQQIEAVPIDPFQMSISVPLPIPAHALEINEIQQQQGEEKKVTVTEVPQPQGDPSVEGAVEGGAPKMVPKEEPAPQGDSSAEGAVEGDCEQAVLQQEVARRSPLFNNIDELDEDTARQLLIDSGWNVSQSVRQGGHRQWYYRTPPPNTSLLGSIAAAVALWKKQVDEEHKHRGGGDTDPYPIVTAFLNKKIAKKPVSKKRKRGRSRA